jgi:hypothetical protein
MKSGKRKRYGAGEFRIGAVRVKETAKLHIALQAFFNRIQPQDIIIVFGIFGNFFLGLAHG